MVGLAIFGSGSAMVTIPVMPEILDAIEERKDLTENMNEIMLHNNVSGYFVMCQGLGESLGPFTSSMLENKIDFRPTQKVMAYGVFIFLVVYLIFCGRPK